VHGAKWWLSERVNDGARPGEVGAFVRSTVQLARAQAAAAKAGLKATVLDDKLSPSADSAQRRVSLLTF
jgi:hypothetical protein